MKIQSEFGGAKKGGDGDVISERESECQLKGQWRGVGYISIVAGLARSWDAARIAAHLLRVPSVVLLE